MTERKCIFDGCDRKHKAHGYCSGHLQRVIAGKPLGVLREPVVAKTKCKVPGCSTTSRTSGLCAKHYMRVRNTGTTEDPVKREPGKKRSHKGISRFFGSSKTNQPIDLLQRKEEGEALDAIASQLGLSSWSMMHGDRL
jgi:hypothetical protein